MEEQSSLFEKFLRTCQKGEVIFEDGATGSEMFIVHSGKVRLLKKATGGKEKTLATLNPGEFLVRCL